MNYIRLISLEGVLRTQTDCIARSTLDREVVYANRAYAVMFCGSEKAAKLDQLIS